MGVKLSSVVEESLRTMIINNDPGEPDEYPCFIFLPPLLHAPDGGRGFDAFYMPTISPVTNKNADWEICKFVIEGMTYFFIVSRPPSSRVEPSVGKDRLLMRISSIEEQSEMHKIILEKMRGHKPKK